MTAPYEGFPLAASEPMMLRFRRHSQTLNAIEYILDDRGADLLIKTPLDPNLDGDRLHLNTKGHDPQSAAHPWIFQNGPLR
jgi:hypothetical protein